ncbi:MAG: nickel pincer cofactor biosynthesis protein LarC [Acidimicrobiales bacterium]
MRVAWFHAFSGIAGDMTLAALIDAGADEDEIRAMLGGLAVNGWELAVEPTMRGGIAATNVQVRVSDTKTQRTAAEVIELIESSALPDRVRKRSVATFVALAGAEAALHDQVVADVHLHEVGGHDAIVDVVGSAIALELLGIDLVESSPVAVGQGTVRSAHGLIPNPAPATVRLLEGIPSYGLDIDLELTTPTGAALLAALGSSHGPMPAMRITASGFGAGDAVLEARPNLLQVVLGDLVEDTARGQPVTLVETNVDDVTGELLADAVAELLAAGAYDAWLTAVTAKKGRPGFVVSALVDPADTVQLAKAMAFHTGSFGVRALQLERWPAERSFTSVQVAGETVGIKVSSNRAKVEHDDAARVAKLTGKSVREVISLAEEAYRQQTPQ